MRFVLLIYQGNSWKRLPREHAGAEVDDLDTFAWRGADLPWGRKP